MALASKALFHTTAMCCRCLPLSARSTRLRSLPRVLTTAKNDVASSGRRWYSIKTFEEDGSTLSEPPRTVNYFELYEVPQSFDLDARTLQRKFRKLQVGPKKRDNPKKCFQILIGIGINME